jgi:LEA14-like dessication related protein
MRFHCEIIVDKKWKTAGRDVDTAWSEGGSAVEGAPRARAPRTRRDAVASASTQENRMRYALIAASLLLGLAGCAEVGKVIGASFERPRLVFEGWEPREVDLEGVTLGLRWRIDNPNSVGLRLVGLDYRLDLEGHQAVTGSAGGGIRIPSRGSAPVDLPVHLRYADVPPIVESLFTRETLLWRISGEVAIDTPVGPIRIPFAHEGRTPAPRPPRVAIEGLSVHDASLTGLTLDVKLRIDNPNAFPLPLGTLAYGLRVAGGEVVRAATHPLAPVPGGKGATLALPVHLSFAAAGEAARRALAGEATEVALQGAAGFGSLKLPLDLKGRFAPKR